MGESENKSGIDPFVWVGIIILVVFVFWVSFVIPNRVGSHTSPANACINNMRQIEGAKNECALVNGKTNGTIVTENDLTNYIKLNRYGKIPQCPAGGKYNFGKVGVS